MEKVTIGNAVLYRADCRDVLPTLPKVDAVVTDPPYGINWKPRVTHQDQPWIDDATPDLRPLLAVGRFHLFWGGQYFADQLPVHEGWLTWVKRPLHCDFSEDGRTYATTELAWRDWGKAAFMAHVWDGGMRAGVADNRSFCHPSQKPLRVMTWCIEHVGDCQAILDPFMGSGTTGVACAQLGRKFIGIELERKYFDTACRRIEDAQRQTALFPPDDYDRVTREQMGLSL